MGLIFDGCRLSPAASGPHPTEAAARHEAGDLMIETFKERGTGDPFGGAVHRMTIRSWRDGPPHQALETTSDSVMHLMFTYHCPGPIPDDGLYGNACAERAKVVFRANVSRITDSPAVRHLPITWVWNSDPSNN
jgi:hypothetical protein